MLHFCNVRTYCAKGTDILPKRSGSFSKKEQRFYPKGTYLFALRWYRDTKKVGGKLTFSSYSNLS